MHRCEICRRQATHHLLDYVPRTMAGKAIPGMWLCDEHATDMTAELRSLGIRHQIDLIAGEEAGRSPGAGLLPHVLSGRENRA
ncbi:MAG TPA: hypothetical protein VFG50_11185 [Rhodothermales bacterium]|nr:hypothetical protein [Rhodothermales bacterium]